MKQISRITILVTLVALGLTATPALANTLQTPMEILHAKALADIKIADAALAAVQADPTSSALYTSSMTAVQNLQTQLDSDTNLLYDAQTNLDNASGLFDEAQANITSLKAYTSGSAHKDFRATLDTLKVASDTPMMSELGIIIPDSETAHTLILITMQAEQIARRVFQAEKKNPGSTQQAFVDAQSALTKAQTDFNFVQARVDADNASFDTFGANVAKTWGSDPLLKVYMDAQDTALADVFGMLILALETIFGDSGTVSPDSRV